MLGWYIKEFVRLVRVGVRGVIADETWAAIRETLRVEWSGMDDNAPALWSREGMYLGE